MTDGLNPEKVTQLLTQSARKLDPGTLSALSNARQKALQRQSMHAPAFTLTTGRWSHILLTFSNHQWLLAVLVVVTLGVATGFWHLAREQQVADLDVAILTDELPIEVFVD